MRFEKIAVSVVAWFAIGGPTPALASPRDWGKAEQAGVCGKEYDDTRGDNTPWGGNIYKKPELVAGALAGDKVSAECKAEVERRVVHCKTDKYEKQYHPKELANDPVNWCNREAVFAIFDQIGNDPVRRKKIDDDAKAKKVADEKAAYEAQIAKVELPKTVKKDAALEKLIAAAYHDAYPDNAILMVIMQSKDWTTERSNYGVVTNRTVQAIVVNKQKDGSCQLHNEAWSQEYIGNKFTGKLGQRGAGSQTLSGILCEKVPGATKK